MARSTRAPAAPERDEAAIRRFVDQMGGLLAEWGFPRMAGRVLLTLHVAEDGTQTASELAASLQASPAAISGAVRLLTQMGMVTREAIPGSRRDRYRLRDHAWYEASLNKQDFLKTLADVSDGAIGSVGGPETDAGARLVELRDFLLFSRDELDALLVKWRESRERPVSPR